MSEVADRCAAEYADCRQDAACSPYALCYADCAFSSMTCLDGCEKKLGDGSAKQKALLTCACGVEATYCWDSPGAPASCAPYLDAGAGGVP
jgi:hypothetical protein